MLAAAPDRPAGNEAPGSRASLMSLLRELGHLKRITSAGRPGSIATRLFLQAWGALVAGQSSVEVMRGTVAAALAAARLGDLDAAKLAELGLTSEEVRHVLRASFEEVAGELDPALRASLWNGLDQALHRGDAPSFARLLAEQPRAGVTCPGKPRVMLQPAENHAEHSLAVALYGVLLAPGFDADPTTVFLIGLGHHFHNAAMPDSGFTGETLLGEMLDGVIARSRSRALAELPPALQQHMVRALEPIAGDATPEAQAFHAADAIDRVLEIEQHLSATRLTMDVVLKDYALVHESPVKPFHDRVLREVGLL